jgi:hypothetical protein
MEEWYHHQKKNIVNSGGYELTANNNSISIFNKNIDLLGLADKAIYYFREQQYDIALAVVAETIDKIKYIVEAIITDRQYFNLVSTESLMEMLNGILEAKRNRDYILLADLYELQLVNFLCSVQELIISKEEFGYDEEQYQENIRLLVQNNPTLKDSLQGAISPAALMENGYRVEFSSCGLMTVGAENEGNKFYFHSNNRITNEAFILAKHWYNENKKNYVIYGFGFGYHITELCKIAKDAKIKIYESDSNILQLACAFADMKTLLDNPNITIIYDPDYQRIEECIQQTEDDNVINIHYPSLKNVKDKEAKIRLENCIPWSRFLENC